MKEEIKWGITFKHGLLRNIFRRLGILFESYLEYFPLRNIVQS
jgi:hypothetical protein